MEERWYHRVTVITILLVTQSQAKIMRNNALMNKMVSHFQTKDNYLPLDQNKPKEQEEFGNIQKDPRNNEKPEHVMSLMQNVLCRNFPTIPCKIITEDETLRKLIEKSIQQIKYKTINQEKTTSSPEFHLTLFPSINSEDLSNFLQVRQNTFYNGRNLKEDRSNRKQKNTVNYWSQEKTQKNSKKNKKESKRTSVFTNRKKIRKFYPHKIKYKDKNFKGRKDLMDNSDERLSMSVEDPDMTLTKRHEHLSYRVEPANPPVWRIDYMKHGEPSLNKLRFEDDRLKGKLVKTGPSMIVDENVLERGARKEVLHPDVYIKKNFLRKTPVEINSEGGD